MVCKYGPVSKTVTKVEAEVFKSGPYGGYGSGCDNIPAGTGMTLEVKITNIWNGYVTLYIEATDEKGNKVIDWVSPSPVEPGGQRVQSYSFAQQAGVDHKFYISAGWVG